MNENMKGGCNVRLNTKVIALILVLVLALGGVFGGTFTAYYRRKATSYYTSTSSDFSLSLSCKKKGQGEAKNWMESYLQAQAMQGGTLEYGKESSNSDLQETSEEEYKFEVRGGNESGDFDNWSASIADENSNLALVSYSPVENMCCLIPLWYLAADEARRNALKENLDKYIKENAEKDDLVITLGCGDIYKAAKMMLKEF